MASLPVMRSLGLVWLTCWLLLTGACDGLFGEGQKVTADQQQQLDIAAYNATEQRLTAGRREFASKKYSYQQAVGNQLFFLDFPGFDPRLHRFDPATQARLDYEFSIGSGEAFNFRASEALVVTARKQGSTVVYSAYEASAKNQQVGTTSFMAPSDAKWWAYAVSGEQVYVVTYDAMAQKTQLYQWSPRGTLAPKALFSLEAATGQPMLGIFLDFGVDGDTLVFIESGRIWKGSLASGRATWLRNQVQIDGGNVDFQADGVTFSTAKGMFFFKNDSMQLWDVTQKISASPFQLSDTFKGSHRVSEGGFSRYGDYIVYIGGAGVFAYDLVRDTITPVLLEPRPDGPGQDPSSQPLRIEYRYPQVTTDGTLYVTGLTSASGSVGADGPIYSVDLKPLLPIKTP